MTTTLIPLDPDYRGLEKAHADFHFHQFRQSRKSLLSELRCVSGLPELARTLDRDTLYKLVVPEGKLLQRGKDGLFRGVFYGDRGIDHHAAFAEVRPNLMAAAKAIGSQVLLISIAMQLNRIQAMVENLSIEMHRDRIAEVFSGVNQFEDAMLFQDTDNRRDAILHAIQTLHTGLQKTISELGSRIADAPKPENSILYHLVPWNNKTQQASKIMGLAQESFSACVLGVKTLSECYATLDEMEVASKALSDYFEMILNCDIEAAANKARLVEFTGSVAPQEPWEAFIRLHRTVKDRLRTIGGTDSHNRQSEAEIEFMPSDLEGDLDGNLP